MFRVRDLLAVMYEDERVTIDFPTFSTGTMRCEDVFDFLEPFQLDKIVQRVWRSVYEVIVIEVEG